MKLDLQVAFKLGNYLISHAGYTQDYVLEDWHFERITENTIDNVDWINSHVGISRGGKYISGSPLWADFKELSHYPNIKYLKQIVGHSPQNKISNMCTSKAEIICIDTFTVIPLKQHPYYQQLGTGEVLLCEDDRIQSLSLNWRNDDIIRKIDLKFDRK